MQLTIKIQNFDMNCDDHAVFHVYDQTQHPDPIMKITIRFAAGDNNDEHAIETSMHPRCDDHKLPHYSQAMLIMRASEMLESFFDEVEPLCHDEVDA